MKSNFLRLTLAGALSVVAVLGTAAAPVAAAGDGDRGSIVSCDYHYLDEDSRYWGGILKHITVSAPTLNGLHAAPQSVAWRFTVERQNVVGEPPVWKQTYISPKQTATASSTSAAAFSAMSVNVYVPKFPGWQDGGLNDYYYRVAIKLFWYRANGSVEKKVVHQMKHYDNTFEGEYGWSGKGDYQCPGGHSEYVD